MFKFLQTGGLRLAGVAAVLSLSAWPIAQAHAQSSPDGVWQQVAEPAITRSAQARQIIPQAYRTVRLAHAQFAAAVRDVPQEQDVPLQRSAARLSLPLADGSFADFQIVEAPIMDPQLAARYPGIRTWLGQGISDPTATLRFDQTPRGFHAQIISWQGTTYIDPFQPGDADHYIVYRKRDAQALHERPRCLVTGQELPLDAPDFSKRGVAAKLASGANLRTYRLAVAATGEYTAFHGGTVVDGLAGIVTTMNRVNGIYEREVSVRMVLVANTDTVIYTNSGTDPFTDNDPDALINEVQTHLDAMIGSSNYDIGHVVSTGGGGLAGLGVVCINGSKGAGVTGSSAPVGDAYDVDYVAHEMGHQFGGNHTFNGSGGACAGGNRNPTTAYEPGSGVTIQAYAGICGADNTQPNSEDYFHRVSLDEIIDFTTAAEGATCGVSSATGNTPPSVTTTAAYTIPKQTPFELTASGSDADNDALTYIWEQYDRAARNTAGTLVDNGGPLFRSFEPQNTPTRIFPSLRYILNNANVAPAAAPLPGTTTPNRFTAELLPSTARTLHFRVTARDNRAGGGGTNEAATALTVSATSGPFAVTAPNTAVSWAAGSTQTVTWNVAATDVAPVSTGSVRISLSVDGGFTYPIELAASEANDGSASITVPANAPASTQARVRVQAVGNVYFDVSDSNFTITGSNTAPTITVVPAGVTTRQGSPAATGTVATLTDTQDAPGTLAVSVSGAPPELSVSVSNTAGTVSLTATAACTLVAPTGGNKVYPLLLRVTDSAGAVSTASVNVNVGANQVPTLGSYGAVAVANGNSTTATPSAAPADANNNLIAPSVSPASLPGGGSLSIASTGVVTITTLAGTLGGTYTVRAAANDSCGATEIRQFTVTVSDTLFKNGFE